jgi:putative pyruvate formate lyase activating enzyme
MPDMKYADSSIVSQCSAIEDYATINRAAVKEMDRQVGDLRVEEKGIAVRGLLVRHLVLPSRLARTRETGEFLPNSVSSSAYVNIMAQYHHCHRAYDFPFLSISVTKEEYLEAVTLTLQHGLNRLDQVLYPRTARVSF